MPAWLASIIGTVIGALLVFLEQFWSSRGSRWKLNEDRKTEYAKRRESLYNKALELVYAIEGSQSSVENLELNFRRLNEWIFSDAFLLPPTAKDVLFTLRVHTMTFICDMSNKDLDKEERKLFRDSLAAAKGFFLESRDIAWLPPDLSRGR